MGFPRQECWRYSTFPPPGGLSWPRDQTHVSCIGRWVLYHWTNRTAHWATYQMQLKARVTSLSPTHEQETKILFHRECTASLHCRTAYSLKRKENKAKQEKKLFNWIFEWVPKLLGAIFRNLKILIQVPWLCFSLQLTPHLSSLLNSCFSFFSPIGPLKWF